MPVEIRINHPHRIFVFLVISKPRFLIILVIFGLFNLQATNLSIYPLIQKIKLKIR